MDSTSQDNRNTPLEEEAPALGALGNLMDSKTSHLDDLLSEKLESAFDKETLEVIHQDVAAIAAQYSPIDLAHAAPRLPPSARAILYDNLQSRKAKAEFMINADSGTRLAVFRSIDDGEVKQLIEEMAPDEAVKVLEPMTERRFRRVIELVDPQKAQLVKEVKHYRRNTAGRLMTSEFFAFPLEMTIGEASEMIRKNPGIDLTRRVFIINKKGELQGYVPARNLIVHGPHLPLRQIMRPIKHQVTTESTRDEVVDIVERYKIPALPVLDDESRLVGVITYEDVVEAMEDIADETIALMAGTVEKVSEHEAVAKRFFARSPWLIVTLIAGLVNGLLMSSFQVLEGRILTLIMLFVPLITGLSGNIGIQCSTILVRGMAIGVISSGSKREAIYKEMILGVATGVVFGILCGLIVSFFDFLGIAALSPLGMGLIVGIGLFGACVAGTLLGVFSPFFFAKLGVDPAIASGPIITAFNDFLSIAIYFLIAAGLHAVLV